MKHTIYLEYTRGFPSCEHCWKHLDYFNYTTQHVAPYITSLTQHFWLLQQLNATWCPPAKTDFDDWTKTKSWKTLNHFVELINIQRIYHWEKHGTVHAAM